MKAIRMVEPGKPLELQQIPIPVAGAEDVLVRVRATGICHSDAHYRAGRSGMGILPITLGHEVAGEVEWVGANVTSVKAGERVCLHYNISCGNCYYCKSGNEQFCTTVKMIGHHIDGGYGEYIAMPARNAVPLPDEISFEEGASLMCASATALLPCAALYGALSAAAALGSAQAGAVSLATFSLLSGLSLVGAGQLARLGSLGARGRKGLALLLLAGALIMAFRPLATLRAEDGLPACHLHAEVR